MTPTDRSLLKGLATRSLEALKPYRTHPLARIRLGKVRTTNTRGWRVSIASLPKYKCTYELWFDTFTGAEKRKLYYGFHSEKRDGIDTIAKCSRSFMGSPRVVTDSRIDLNAYDFELLTPFRRADFGRPVLERYAMDFLYGIYVFDRTGLSHDPDRRLVNRVSEFFGDVLDRLRPAKRPDDVYPRKENRRQVALHLRRERSGHLSLMRKQKDDYVCSVCGFSFFDKYGVLGRGFAECHHLVPLGKDKKARITKFEDLATVCSNCHRMLHRMDGRPEDVSRLRRVLRRQRRQIPQPKPRVTV